MFCWLCSVTLTKQVVSVLILMTSLCVNNIINNMIFSTLVTIFTILLGKHAVQVQSDWIECLSSAAIFLHRVA